MKLLIEDNYFNDPDFLRSFAFSLGNYRVSNGLFFEDQNGEQDGWRGERSLPLKSYNNSLLNSCSNNILNVCYEYFNLKNFKTPYGNIIAKNLTITTYFHITTEETKKSLVYFCQDKFHLDSKCLIAGVVYLSPNAPINAGTTILDAENNKMVNVENIYNRLVAYESYRIHGFSDTFGNSREDGRLTFTFFIHEQKYSEYFD